MSKRFFACLEKVYKLKHCDQCCERTVHIAPKTTPTKTPRAKKPATLSPNHPSLKTSINSKA